MSYSTRVIKQSSDSLGSSSIVSSDYECSVCGDQEETGLNVNLVRSGAIYIVLVSKPTFTSKLLFGPALTVKTDLLCKSAIIMTLRITFIYGESVHKLYHKPLVVKVVPLSNNLG